MKSVNPMMVVAVLLWVVCGAAWAGGSIEFSGGFSGGTVPNAVVLTGDNASGTGTLRIRPSDEDTQLVLCEASNNSSPEMCSSFNHVNATATSFLQMTTNGYLDSATAWTRFNTSAGTTGIYTQASTTNASNVIGQVLYSTNNTVSGSALFAVTGAGASTYTIGQNGTVTTDIRGPITNGGSATCNSVNAGSLCMNDTMMIYGGSGVPYLYIQPTANNLSSGVSLMNSSGTGVGGFLYYGSGAAIMPNTVIASKSGVVFSVADTTDIAATSSFRTDVEDFDGTPIVHGGVYGDGADYKLAVSPTALSGNVDNYAGCTKARCRIDPNGANRNVTGLTQGADGKILTLCNIATGFNVVLMDSVTSTAANQFALDADFTILPERCQEVVYDGTSSRWRLNN